jgi:secondary thiamine-phosphate synthase enzyme
MFQAFEKARESSSLSGPGRWEPGVLHANVYLTSLRSRCGDISSMYQHDTMPPPNPTQPSIIRSPHFTILFLCIFLIAFFPGLPQFLLKLPFRPFQFRHHTPSFSELAPPPPNMATSWFQKTLHLPAKSRGSYLITDMVVSQLPEIRDYKIGLLTLFAQHTSCALSLNENWDEDVRADMSDTLDRIVPEDRKGNVYRHSCEGPDDMPAHVKSALIGASVTVPITDGKLATGTWQGIWYLEFRTAKHSRNIVATIQGEKK